MPFHTGGVSQQDRDDRERDRQDRERQERIAAQAKAKAKADAEAKKKAKAKADAEAKKKAQGALQVDNRFGGPSLGSPGDNFEGELMGPRSPAKPIFRQKGDAGRYVAFNDPGQPGYGYSNYDQYLVGEARKKNMENAPNPLDEQTLTAIKDLADRQPNLSVEKLIANSDELLGTDPSTLKNYLVGTGVDIKAGTMTEVKDIGTKTTQPTSEFEVTADKVAEDIEKKTIDPATGSVSKTVGTEQIDTAQKELSAEAQKGTAEQITGDTKRIVTEDEKVTAAVATPEELSEINMVAATAEPSDRATTRGQLELLQKDFEGGKIPPYAAGQIRAANAIMLQRGIGASSIAGQAVMQAALESSVQVAMADAKAFQTFEMASLTNEQQAASLNAQIRAKILGQELTNRQQAAVVNAARVSEANNLTFTAEQRVMLENSKMMQQMELVNLNNKQQTALANAATFANMEKSNLDARMQAQVANAQNFLQMDMANLKNEQQGRVLEYQSVVQGMLSDQAAENAAQQFNAKNKVQVDQFYAELNTQIEQANATRTANTRQFNVNQQNAMKQFNETMKLNREKFNSNARLQIDQSNVEWRRQINTANTAEQNASNRLQYQTVMAQTTQAQNNLWNHYRDQASWLMTTAENREQRAHDAAMLAAQIAGNKDLYRTEFLNNLLLEIGTNL